MAGEGELLLLENNGPERSLLLQRRAEDEVSANGNLRPRRVGKRRCRRLLPMQLQVGDRLSDDTGEWGVMATLHDNRRQVPVRVQMFGQPAISELRTWGAHERMR